MEERCKTELADWLIQRDERMASDAASWYSFYQDVANYVMPRKAEILTKTTTPNFDKTQRIFDSTAVQANQVLANGHLSWMTPHETPWFSFDPPPQVAGDKSKSWFKWCTEIAQNELSRSNFYSEIHEFYLDRGGFGTSVILCEEGKRNTLLFTTLLAGTYKIQEDDEGYVDTLHRDLTLTVRQAAEKFGAENLHETVRQMLESGNPKELDAELSFLHAIFPRNDEDRMPDKIDGPNKPWASVYVDRRHKHVCREGGYDEQPFFCSRYLKWSSSVYGYSPAWIALPDARQLNFLQMNLDALCEIQVFPRLLVPDTHEGDIDLRAHGMTFFDPNMPNALPREWATQGRYDIGLERAQEKQKAINEAYMVDVFRMFSQLDKQMTAREVSERASEKLTQFSSTFARMTTELFNPLLRRVFNVLARAGKFPPMPREAMETVGNVLYVPEPELNYSSRIALASKQLANSALLRQLETDMEVAQFKPEILDNYDWDTIVRETSRNNGLPENWLSPVDAVEEMRSQRAQAQAAAQQQQQVETIANAAQKVGSIRKDSLVGKALGAGQG